MSDLTPLQDSIASSSEDKEGQANYNFFGVSLASWFARRRATAGLTWQYTGVDRWPINGVATVKANGSIAITPSATRYVQADRALAVTEVPTEFGADRLGLFKLTTGASSITGQEDWRNSKHLVRFLYDRQALAMADANKTLTYLQAMADSLELTGALTALRDVIVPTIARAWTIYANTTGGFGVRVKTSAGTGITVADTKRAIVECDGTNVVRITPDT
jgi:hypothetical protein